jgi:hypothetical protein
MQLAESDFGQWDRHGIAGNEGGRRAALRCPRARQVGAEAKVWLWLEHRASPCSELYPNERLNGRPRTDTAEVSHNLTALAQMPGPDATAEEREGDHRQR